MSTPASPLSQPPPPPPRDFIGRDKIESVRIADVSKVQEVAASQIQILNVFYEEVLGQAHRAFRTAIIASISGFALLALAVLIALFQQSIQVASLGVISGTIMQFIAGVNFYLYGRTASQMAEYHTRLSLMQKYLIANSICERLETENMNHSRAELIRAIAGIPPDSQLSEKQSKAV